MPRNLRMGAHAEDAAASFLEGLGYTLVTRNYHAPQAEIDIIAMDGDNLVFVEVKQRKVGSWVSPEESVGLAKQTRLWQAADYYLAEVVGKALPARFDVIAVVGETLRHHKDAFRPA
ncbi:MAG: YraN family protein [Armatimonadetes bacterium]|nr:YraN family protein [Armatimonadota bacterium]